MDEKYLQETFFLDWKDPLVMSFAEKYTDGLHTEKEKAINLYLAVRDLFWYNPYQIHLTKEAIKASSVIKREQAYCVEKANLLAALIRAVGIPSRLGFANVQNHFGTSRLEEILETNVMVFHGYTEIFLSGKWLKATPAFNKELCEKSGVAPLEFNGEEDSLFQQFNKEGDMFMEYLHDYGTFDDLPFDYFVSELKSHYPHVFQKEYLAKGDFILRL